MESFLDKAISAYPELNIIDSSEGVLEEHNEEYSKENNNFFDNNIDNKQVNDDVNASQSKDENAEHSHNHGENAHIWVSIDLYIKQVTNIANNLAKIDEKNADKYLNNSYEYIDKLYSLRNEMHTKLSNIENPNIVTFHEAFEFFAEEFGLNIVGVIEREPGTNPSAGEVAKIIDKIKETSAVAIFVEPQYEQSTADVIARETNVPVYNLDPVVTGELDKDAYLNIMRKNLETLEEALVKRGE